MTFPAPHPRGTPAPAKKPRKHFRGTEFEKSTQAIFGKGRITSPDLIQPPHYGSGQQPTAPVDQVAIDTTRALRNSRNDRSEPVRHRSA